MRGNLENGVGFDPSRNRDPKRAAGQGRVPLIGIPTVVVDLNCRPKDVTDAMRELRNAVDALEEVVHGMTEVTNTA